MVQDPIYWLCLAASVAIFWLLPLRLRYGFLAFVSFAYILWLDWSTALAMLLISGLVYALYSPRAPAGVARFATKASIAVAVLYLGYFKYLPALVTLFAKGYSFAHIALPLGISYFSFKMIHYAVERGRKVLPAHGPDDFLAYIFLVPIFTAGPIQRFDLFMAGRSESWVADHAWIGLTRIALGLIKKFVFGAIITVLIAKVTTGDLDTMLAHLHDVSPLRAVAFLILSYLSIYMDFAGYTDIAIGSSRLFGLTIMENFNFPIFAPNIGNLWKRWHMSLASWCQSYIYMPTLGYSRNPYVAVFASFAVMGLWHSASVSYLAWGLYNAGGVATYQFWSTTARRRKWAFTKTPLAKAAGYPVTFLFFAGGFAFTMTSSHGLWSAFRLLAKCFFVNLPA